MPTSTPAVPGIYGAQLLPIPHHSAGAVRFHIADLPRVKPDTLADLHGRHSLAEVFSVLSCSEPKFEDQHLLALLHCE